MKEMLQANARLLLLSVLILSNSTVALAYYHPEEGRWLSRDPLGDFAFRTQYSSGKSRRERVQIESASLRPSYLFVENDPVLRTDPNGLLLFPFDVICAFGVYLAYRDTTPPPGYPGEPDAWMHCLVGCKIGRFCGLAISVGAAGASEIIIDVFDLDGLDDVEWLDFVNTVGGTVCAVKLWLSCETCCMCQAP